ncbi:MAG: hypothetical protein JXA33_29210 [Anaerolineae bacterium]|nr:hypothetical protein [Anaerolineae bacterium]
MTDEHTQEEKKFAASSEAWKQVGTQFQALGENIAAAFRSAWEDEKTQQYLHEMEKGLTSMAQAFGQAVDEAAQSPEAQKFRAEAQKAAQSARDAGAKAAEDARPHIISALETVSAELQKLIDKLGLQIPDEEDVPET